MTGNSSSKGETAQAAVIGPSYWRNRWRCTVHPLMVAERADSGSVDAHYIYVQQQRTASRPMQTAPSSTHQRSE